MGHAKRTAKQPQKQCAEQIMFPKQNYFRSKKHLKLVASLPCQLCGADNLTQAAHSNWVQWGGKGRSIKASDEYTAALCMSCHFDIDQGIRWSKAERQLAWKVAHYKTVQALTDSKQWPPEVPIPVIE
jgi:hypothetical protein